MATVTNCVPLARHATQESIPLQEYQECQKIRAEGFVDASELTAVNVEECTTRQHSLVQKHAGNTQAVISTAEHNRTSGTSCSVGCSLVFDTHNQAVSTGAHLGGLVVNKTADDQQQDVRVPDIAGGVQSSVNISTVHKVSSGLCQVPGPQREGEQRDQKQEERGLGACVSAQKKGKIACAAVGESHEEITDGNRVVLDNETSLAGWKEQISNTVARGSASGATGSIGTASAPKGKEGGVDNSKRRRLDLHTWANSLLQ
jgi:hypothetical protein